MAVAQPTFLMVFNESSGTSLTNYGTQGTPFTIIAGSSPTDYSWNPNAAPLDGYLQSNTSNGANTPALSNAGATVGTSRLMNLYIKFRVTSLGGFGRGDFIGVAGRMFLRAITPAGGGDFDLEARMKTTGDFGYPAIIVASALTFGTDYSFAMSLNDVGGGSQVELKHKLDGASVVTEAAVSNGADSGANAIPYLNCGISSGFTDFYAVVGRFYAIAFGVGQTAWGDTDLADVISNPAANIGGWPAGGGSSVAVNRYIDRQRRR